MQHKHAQVGWNRNMVGKPKIDCISAKYISIQIIEFMNGFGYGNYLLQGRTYCYHLVNSKNGLFDLIQDAMQLQKQFNCLFISLQITLWFMCGDLKIRTYRLAMATNPVRQRPICGNC